jgi:UDP:flavonoid glycosyltransferase YjiC (YdhE family)
MVIQIRTKYIKNLSLFTALGQSKIRAFISRCGLNSVVEVVKAGIPLICIPLFGNQPNNSETLVSRGAAVVIGKK